MKERETWIDNARSLAILFVIFGHFNPEMDVFFFFTSYIKIPLFFCISGYLFKFNKESGLRVQVIKKVKKLLIPYFTLSIISMLPMVLLSIKTGNAVTCALELIRNTMLGEVLWFLPCLFIAEMYATIWHGFFTKIKPFIKYLLSLVIGFVVMMIIPEGKHIYWHPETALIMLISFDSGMMLRYVHQNQKIKENLDLCFCGIAYGLILVMQFVLNGFESIDVNNNVFGNIPLDFLGIIIGPIFIMCLCKKVAKSKALAFIGRNTLTFYAFHGLAYSIINKLMETFTEIDCKLNAVWGGLGTLLNIIVVCLICAVFSFVINRLCPWMVGKNNCKKNFKEVYAQK